MSQFEKSRYEQPYAEAVHLKEECIICTSPLSYSGNPGTPGDDIDELEIINGGSF